MKTDDEYNEMTKTAAYNIVKNLKSFDSEPKHIYQQLVQFTNSRVNRMMNGVNEEVDGETKIIDDDDDDGEQQFVEN